LKIYSNFGISQHYITNITIMKNAIIAISTSVVLAGILFGLAIYGAEMYGVVLFLLVPVLIGFLPGAIYAKLQGTLTRAKSYKLGFGALGVSLLALLIFALEGMVCIIMASPLLILGVLLGAYIAASCYGERSSTAMRNKSYLLLAAIGLSTTSFDYMNTAPQLIAVKTSVRVAADINTVWENVVTFDEIAAPKDWLFKTGIAYPTNATIAGTGVGAVRYCNFTTGSFVEPISTWNAPHLLQFDVLAQPIPMHEYNPFWEVHPPHLDGYFQSHKGQFELRSLPNNQTLLMGTTWYTVNIKPEFYWSIWSDYIIHRIHKRVLQHIKTESEQL